MDKSVIEMTDIIKKTIEEKVKKRELSKSNHCKMSLLNLITFAIL